MKKDLAGQIVDWAFHLEHRDLEPVVLRHALDTLIDTLAVGWAGSRALGADKLATHMLSQSGAGRCRVWSSRKRTTAATAAFLNALSAGALDFDAVHEATGVHAWAVVLPPLWALADEGTVEPKKFLVAAIVGIELLVRLAAAARRNPGWYLSSVFGIVAATIACSLLLELTPAQALHAVGICLSRAAGTLQPLVEGVSTKSLQTAFAARDAVESVQLARLGVTAPQEVFSGRAGMEALYVALDHTQVLEALGTRFLFSGYALKAYPCCYGSHAAIHAALHLAREHRIQGRDVADCLVRLSPYSFGLVGAPYDPATDPQAAAMFSVRYAVARALLNGTFGLDDIQPESAQERDAVALASMVRVKVDDAFTGKFVPAAVRIALRDGSTVEHTVDVLEGGTSLPFTRASMRSKASGCFGAGALPLDPEAAAALLADLERLPELGDVRDVWRSLERHASGDPSTFPSFHSAP